MRTNPDPESHTGLDPRRPSNASTVARAAAAVVGAIVALAASDHVALVGSAHADGDPATDGVPRVVPYEGIVEADGVGVDGALAVRFEIYDGTVAVWSEEQTVTVHAGRFAALLGSTTPIDPVFEAADDLTLGVTVLNGPGLDDDVPLSGRQRFVPVPYALWAATSSDLTVARDLFVTRNVEVTGATRFNGPLTFDGRNTGGWIEFSDGVGGDTETRSFECAADEYICGVQAMEYTGDPTDVRNVLVRCCSLGQ